MCLSRSCSVWLTSVHIPTVKSYLTTMLLESFFFVSVCGQYLIQKNLLASLKLQDQRANLRYLIWNILFKLNWATKCKSPDIFIIDSIAQKQKKEEKSSSKDVGMPPSVAAAPGNDSDSDSSLDVEKWRKMLSQLSGAEKNNNINAQ